MTRFLGGARTTVATQGSTILTTLEKDGLLIYEVGSYLVVGRWRRVSDALADRMLAGDFMAWDVARDLL